LIERFVSLPADVQAVFLGDLSRKSTPAVARALLEYFAEGDTEPD
jgi:hypothetical protein